MYTASRKLIFLWLLVTTCFFLEFTGRRSAPPLNLTGLPGTEKLNEREKEVQPTFFHLQLSAKVYTPMVSGF